MSVLENMFLGSAVFCIASVGIVVLTAAVVMVKEAFFDKKLG